MRKKREQMVLARRGWTRYNRGMRKPLLDPNFEPMQEVLLAYERDVRESAHPQEVSLTVSHADGCYTYRYLAFADGVDDARNVFIAEKLSKTLLWVVGGDTVGVSGSDVIFEALKGIYSASGARAFDSNFMEEVYERTFRVVKYAPEEVPETKLAETVVGGHLDGCRIGFDAGGSDRKVSAVIDGKAVYSEEVVWNPKTQTDACYHYDGILTAMKTAASKMPRVDAIGVSSAGVYLNNQIKVASLFIKVDKKKQGEFIKNMYIDIAKKFGDVPLVVANDGDVTALAGSMSTGRNCVLGIAMGTSEAVGYINERGGLNGWLSELAFVPVDASKAAMTDEWSGDKGVGCKYFSQDAVIKLAEAGGYAFREGSTPAEKLKEIQELAEKGNALARQIFEDIGVYLAHTLPYYARFYKIGLVLLLGRVTAGVGGSILLESCKETLAELGEHFDVSLPDEKSRRVGQSIAAASLPKLG